jgi:MFS family permease
MSLKAGAGLLWNRRPFRILFVGRIISLTGSTIAPIALAFAVLDLTPSPIAFGLVLAAGYLPLVIFLLVGGVIADRMRRGPVMVWSNVVSALTQAVVAALLLTRNAQIWQLIALASVAGIAGAFFGPASAGIVPQVVDADELHDANALLRLSMNSIKVLGPAASGVAVTAVGPGWAIAWDALTFVIAALMLSRLRIPLPLRKPATMLTDLKAGWEEFWSRTWLWTLVLQYALVNAVWVGGFQLLGPIVAQQRLGGASAWGAIVAALAAGLLAGGVLVLAWKPRRPLLAATVSTFTKAAPLAVLALAQPLYLLIATAFIAGVGTEIFVVCFYSTMQRRVPADRMSRVSSYDIFFGTLLIPVGYLVTGPVASWFGASSTLWAGVVAIVISTIATLTVPAIRTDTPDNDRREAISADSCATQDEHATAAAKGHGS